MLAQGTGRRPRQPDRVHRPGPDGQPGPELHRGCADRRGGPPPFQGLRADAAEEGRQRPRGRTSRLGEPARPRGRRAQVPAPAFRRHAAALCYRAGAVWRPGRADRGRTDHRAGRDDPGGDPGAAAPPAGNPEHGDPAHHPRLGGGRTDRRPDRGHVRRRDCRGGRRGGPAGRAGAPLRAGSAGLRPVRALPGHGLPVIPGSVPVPGAWRAGCRFAPRCAEAEQKCSAAPVAFTRTAAGHFTRCVHAEARVQA